MCKASETERNIGTKWENEGDFKYYASERVTMKKKRGLLPLHVGELEGLI